MSPIDPVARHAAQLRREFDAAFAKPVAATTRERTSLIEVRVQGDVYAVKTLEIDEIQRGSQIVHLPTDVPALLGLAGHRDELLPVYSLARLLGYGTQHAAPPWLLRCGGRTPFALAFDDLDGYHEVSSADIRPAPTGDGERAHVVGAVPLGDGLRSVIGIPSIRHAISDRVATATKTKER